MAAVFGDSFNGYATLLLKWSSGSLVEYNTDPAFIRTGTQSFKPEGTSNPALPRINFANTVTMTAGVAVYLQHLNTTIFKWLNFDDQDELGIISVAGDGSIDLSFNNTVLARSAPGFVSAGAFFYIEAKCTFLFVGGTCEVRVNGQTALTFTGRMAFSTEFSYVDQFTLPGNDSIDVYYNDFYLLDDSGGVNDDFLGPIQVFALVPDENETPLDWTPLANTNWQEVSQVPPPVDDSAYVFAGTEGDVDQYHYTITGPSEAYEIKFVQHSLCCKLDAPGAHTVASQINTHTSGPPKVGSDAPDTNYAYAIFPWDVNPNTGVPFLPTDFATTFFGPVITS